MQCSMTLDSDKYLLSCDQIHSVFYIRGTHFYYKISYNLDFKNGDWVTSWSLTKCSKCFIFATGFNKERSGIEYGKVQRFMQL